MESNLRNTQSGMNRETEIITLTELPEAEIILPDESAEDQESYPEGGFQAWLVVVGSFFGFIADFGLLNSMGSIQAYITKNQLADVPNVSVASGWVFAIFTAMSYAGNIFSGIVFDEYGTKIPMIAGTACFTAGLLATANANTPYQFVLSFGILCGMGVSLCMNPLMGVISHWFNKRRARATGFSSLGGSVGGVVFPIMLRKLYVSVGFVWAIRVLALICFTCFVIAFVLIKARLSQRRNLRSDFSNEPLQTRIKLNLINIWIYLKNTIDLKGLKDPKFAFCVAAIIFSEVSLVNTLTYIGSYSLAVGVDETKAYLMITVLNVAGIFGRAIPGILADKYGPYNINIIMVSVVAFCDLVIWLAFGQNEKALWAFIVIYGFFSATVLSLTPVCCGAISPTRDFGKRYATSYLFTGLGTLVCVPIAGALIGDGSIRRYNYFIIYTGLLALAGAICWIISRYFIVGKRLNVKV